MKSQTMQAPGQLALDLTPRPPADSTARFVEFLRSEPSPQEVAQELVLGYLGNFHARMSFVSLVDSDASLRLIGGFGLPVRSLELLGSGSLWHDSPAARAIRTQQTVVDVAGGLVGGDTLQEGLPNQAATGFIASPLMTSVSMLGTLCVGFENSGAGLSLAAQTLEALADIYVLYLLTNLKESTPSVPEPGMSAHQSVVHATTSPTSLSSRQRVILSLLARNFTYDQIAMRIGFSHSTVRAELMLVYRAFGVSSRREAVSVAIRQGIVQSPPIDVPVLN